ncbi:unnamed protein product [Mytilus coruscus]|uniref:Uncharacterized protein n=1 Tax=Mytilus coruscus TaxID=42192 RepID=A0A6J8B2J2_MYTCO|nr:unnamed protein product [Mytilus coruscus]
MLETPLGTHIIRNENFTGAWFYSRPEEFTRVSSYSKHPPPISTKRTSFKYKYVYCNGGIATYKSGSAIPIQATTLVSAAAHDKAATIVSRMVRHMPSNICNKLASHDGVCVFTKQETLDVCPGLSAVADRPSCRGTCAGSCSNTCSSDGRKYSSLAGSGGQFATIIDDNLLCDSADPYGQTFNVLVHEFSHTIHRYAVDSAMKSRIHSAYLAAKSRRAWEPSSYAMSTEGEYFAQGATAYLNANQGVSHGNYMQECSPGNLCKGEMAMRYHLYEKDRALYSVLAWVYSSNKPNTPNNLAAYNKRLRENEIDRKFQKGKNDSKFRKKNDDHCDINYSIIEDIVEKDMIIAVLVDDIDYE